MKRTALLVLVSLAVLGILPAGAVADPNNDPATFELHLEVPNVAEAPNGDRVSVTGGGVFSVHPKSVTASGGFTHTDGSGAVVGSGTWTATQLLSFEFYGCGVLTFADPDITLPPNFCGGVLKLAVVLRPAGTSLALRGVLTIFCIVGPQTSEAHDEPDEEGVTLVVPGVATFNKLAGGMNIYIRTA